MSAIDAKVVDALRRFFLQEFVKSGEVSAVDKDTRTCTVKLPSGLELEGIHLQPLTGGKAGLVCIPKVGSDCIVLELGGNEYYLLCATELDTVYLNTEIEIVINDGTNKGVAISPALVEKYNALEDDLNTLKRVFTSWVPVSNDGGAALKSAISSWAGQSLTRTAIDDIQNEKFKH